jgi:hypothetical protein
MSSPLQNNQGSAFYKEDQYKKLKNLIYRYWKVSKTNKVLIYLYFIMNVIITENSMNHI